MQKLVSNVRWSVRLLLKSPGFTVAALLSLSLGIGITTLVFTFASGTLLKTIPVPDPDRLVFVYGGRPTFTEYVALRDQTDGQLDLVASFSRFTVINTGTDSATATILTVSDNYFQALGVRPAAGRFPTVEPGQQTSNTCVISHQLWTARFGGSHEAVGKTIRLADQLKVTVTGVGPRDFRGAELSPVDIWLPVSASQRKSEKLQWQLTARLRPGISIAHAHTVLQEGYSALGIGAAETDGKSRVGVQSLEQRQRLLYAPVTFFTGLGFLVLLVGCANVAGLLSTRFIERRTEIAVRLALGSGRFRLIGQLLTESALLAVLACGVALALTWALIRVVKPLVPPNLLVSVNEVSVDARVFAATLAFASVATLVAGLLPAWRASRTDVISAIKGNAFVGGALNPPVSMRKTLVVLQLAVSFAFICIGGLFVRSMSLKGSDLQSDRLVLINLAGSNRVQAAPEPNIAHGTALETLRAVPGVEQVTVASSPPLAPDQRSAVRTTADDSREMISGAAVVGVLANYFETTGTALVRGRTLTDRLKTHAGSEVVISESMGRRFWPGLDPLGRQVVLGKAGSPACVVVGVAKDIRASAAALYERPIEPVVYVPAYSPVVDVNGSYFAVLSMRGPAKSFLPEIRAALLKHPAFFERPECETLETFLGYLNRPQRFGALFALILGLLAGTLAAFGLYAVTSSIVAARTREIGIRVALGATVGQTVGLFLKQGLRLSLCGIVLGTPLAWGAAVVLRSGMFGIVPVDLSTMVLSAIAVTLATLVASYLPARRAARVDPMTALRAE